MQPRYIYIYDELLEYHFVEHMAAAVYSSRQSQLEHEKGMQSCNGKEHRGGEEGRMVFVEEQNEPVLLGFF
jgi:hypothetical protein